MNFSDMNIIEKLTESFKEFPGIGERQAKRFVYFLMFKNGDYINDLSKLILDLKKEIAQCKQCFKFFIISKSNEKNICEICKDKNVDSSKLMIVEKDSDLESMQKSKAYNGKYFILGGLVPVIEKNTKKKIRIEELKQRISNSPKMVSIENQNKLEEIILAFSLNLEGNHTDSYVRDELDKKTKSLDIKISSLGRGLSTGTELEYSDNETLKNALKNRQ